MSQVFSCLQNRTILFVAGAGCLGFVLGRVLTPQFQASANLREYSKTQRDTATQSVTPITFGSLSGDGSLAQDVFSIVTLSTQKPEAALELALQIERHQGAMIELIFEQWAKSDPIAAASHYLKNQGLYYAHEPGYGPQTEASSIIAKALVKEDFQKAFEWAQSVGHIDDSRSALSYVIAEVAKDSPQTGVELLNRLNTYQRNQAVFSLAKSWANTGQDGFGEWINSLDSSDRAIAMPGVLSGLAEASPQNAIDYFDLIHTQEQDNPLYDVIQHDSIESLAETLAQDDLGKTVEWLSKADSHSDIRLTHLNLWMRRWLSESPVEARNWIFGQEEGPAKDSAFLSYIGYKGRNALNAQDAHDLISLAKKSISDGAIKQLAMVDAMVSWARFDREQALQFAEASDLPFDMLDQFYYKVGKPLNANSE